MKEFLIVSGSIIVAVSLIPYLVLTIKGKIRPRISSWSTWALITGIATIAAISEGAYTSALLTGISTINEILIVIFAIRHGDKDYSRIDAICQSTSVLGVVFWLVSGSVIWAIFFQMIADMFAAIPTFYHSWIAPHEEDWSPFLIFAFGAAVVASTIRELDFINLGFPIYLIVVSGSLGILILVRQRMVPSEEGLKN